MNDARRRQVAMIKREIYATIERLEIIRQAECNTPLLEMPNGMGPGVSLCRATDSLKNALDHLGTITEWH